MVKMMTKKVTCVEKMKFNMFSLWVFFFVYFICKKKKMCSTALQQFWVVNWTIIDDVKLTVKQYSSDTAVVAVAATATNSMVASTDSAD